MVIKLTQLQEESGQPPRKRIGKLYAWTSCERQLEDADAPASQIGDGVATQSQGENLTRNLQCVQSYRHEEEFQLLS